VGGAAELEVAEPVRDHYVERLGPEAPPPQRRLQGVPGKGVIIGQRRLALR
jgi:hypothetical protein